MNQLKMIAIILTLLLVGFTGVNADVSFHVGLGSSDYYQPVGDYDYLPYAYQTNPGYAAPFDLKSKEYHSTFKLVADGYNRSEGDLASPDEWNGSLSETQFSREGEDR